jgi:hypothetical protein
MRNRQSGFPDGAVLETCIALLSLVEPGAQLPGAPNSFLFAAPGSTQDGIRHLRLEGKTPGYSESSESTDHKTK